jgi:hypothetical protein
MQASKASNYETGKWGVDGQGLRENGVEFRDGGRRVADAGSIVELVVLVFA